MSSDEITVKLRSPEYLRRYFEDTGREYSTSKNCQCPNKSAHSHGDANPSAKIYPNENRAIIKCYGCGGQWDIFSLYQLDNGGTFNEAKKALCERYGIGSDRQTQTLSGKVKQYAPKVQPIKPVECEPNEATKTYIADCRTAYTMNGNAGREYMRQRGISDETAERFGIGYDARKNAVTIPYGEGAMLRSIDPNVSKKERCRFYPTGTQRVLFNSFEIIKYADFGKPIFIVEGEIDALSVAQCGGVAVSCGGTGSIAKVIKAAQVAGAGLYVPCMDRDEAGDKAQVDIERRLAELGGRVLVFKGARPLLLADRKDGTHPKDANEALQQDPTEFKGRVLLAIQQAEAYAEAEEAKNRPYFTLAEISEPPDETTNPRAIFKNGYLRKGGGIIAASVAGAGKSTFSLQCALHWAVGVSCFGIEPVRPLRIAIIQAEDDPEELSMFKANMRKGLASEGFTDERISESLGAVHMRKDFLGKTGQDFADAFKAMQTSSKYDLVIVNPLNSYFEGDISLNKDATEFFRKMIDPIIKTPDTECAIMFIHHMGKPAKGKESTNWGKGAYAQYSLQGAAELNNWARAVLVMIPFENAPDFWTLTAAKRHKPLCWKDEAGNDTKDKIIAYSKDCVYWREPTAEEIKTAREEKKQPQALQETEEQRKAREAAELRQATAELVAYLQYTEPKKKSEIYKWCDQNSSAVFKGFHNHTVKQTDGKPFPKKPCFLAYELIMENPIKYGVGYHVGKYKNGKSYALYGGVASLDGTPQDLGCLEESEDE